MGSGSIKMSNADAITANAQNSQQKIQNSLNQPQLNSMQMGNNSITMANVGAITNNAQNSQQSNQNSNDIILPSVLDFERGYIATVGNVGQEVIAGVADIGSDVACGVTHIASYATGAVSNLADSAGLDSVAQVTKDWSMACKDVAFNISEQKWGDTVYNVMNDFTHLDDYSWFKNDSAVGKGIRAVSKEAIKLAISSATTGGIGTAVSAVASIGAFGNNVSDTYNRDLMIMARNSIEESAKTREYAEQNYSKNNNFDINNLDRKELEAIINYDEQIHKEIAGKDYNDPNVSETDKIELIKATKECLNNDKYYDYATANKDDNFKNMCDNIKNMSDNDMAAKINDLDLNELKNILGKISNEFKNNRLDRIYVDAGKVGLEKGALTFALGKLNTKVTDKVVEGLADAGKIAKHVTDAGIVAKHLADEKKAMIAGAGIGAVTSGIDFLGNSFIDGYHNSPYKDGEFDMQNILKTGIEINGGIEAAGLSILGGAIGDAVGTRTKIKSYKKKAIINNENLSNEEKIKQLELMGSPVKERGETSMYAAKHYEEDSMNKIIQGMPNEDRIEPKKLNEILPNLDAMREHADGKYFNVIYKDKEHKFPKILEFDSVSSITLKGVDKALDISDDKNPDDTEREVND